MSRVRKVTSEKSSFSTKEDLLRRRKDGVDGV